MNSKPDRRFVYLAQRDVAYSIRYELIEALESAGWRERRGIKKAIQIVETLLDEHKLNNSNS